MPLVANKPAVSKITNINQAKKSIPKDRFLLGDSQCHFESAVYLTGRLDTKKVKALLVHPMTTIKESRGDSLKVNFEVENNQEDVANEIKFMGFITAGDASLDLNEDDIEQVQEYILTGEIIKAVTVDELIDLF
jgi:hypothetical protein